MDEGTVAKAEERARIAKSIVEHPMVVEAFEALDKRCWEAFKALGVAKVEEREHIHGLMRAQGDFREFFEILIRDGKNARIAYDKLKQAKDVL